MPYSYPDNVPTFAKNKKADLQKRVIALFNETLSRTNSEEQARRAALAFMSNYEKKYGSADLSQNDKGDATRPENGDTREVDFRRYHTPMTEVDAQAGDTFPVKCYAWVMAQADMAGSVAV